MEHVKLTSNIFMLAISVLISFLILGKIVDNYLYLNHTKLAGSDFLGYYIGAKIIKDGKGALLYDLPTEKSYFEKITSKIGVNDHIVFKNIPFTAYLFTPLVNLKLVDSYRIFTILNLLLFIIEIYLIVKILDLKNFLAIALISFIYLPVYVSLILGQITFFLFFIILLIYLFLKSKQHFLLGFVSGLMFIKIQYLLLLPLIFALAGDKRKYLFGFWISLAFIVSISLYISGAEGVIKYPSYTFATEQSLYKLRYQDMISFASVIYRFLPGISIPNTFYYLIIVFATVLMFLYFLFHKTRVDTDTLFVAAIVFMLVFSPHSLVYDLSLLLLPILIILKRNIENEKFIQIFLVSIFLIQFVSFTYYNFLIPLIFAVIVFFFLSRKSILFIHEKVK